MIDTPEVSVSREELEVYADWLEACALFGEKSECSRDDLIDVLIDSGLAGLSQEEYLPGDAGYGDEGLNTPREKADLFAGEIWSEATGRERVLGKAWPFNTGRSYVLSVDGGSWRDWAAYSFLLLSDLAQVYPGVQSNITPDSGTGRIFEKVVEAAVNKGTFRGAQRFGWPREGGWPPEIDKRIERLASELGLEVGSLDSTEPQDNDRGLDVVARVDIGDARGGTGFLLFQCAAGNNWKDKRGEPSYQDWNKLLKWQGKLVKALAVPWRLPKRSDKTWPPSKVHRKFDAVVFDRVRIAYGHPDRCLEPGTKQEVVEWCERRIAELPVAG